MASVLSTSLYQNRGLRTMVSTDGFVPSFCCPYRKTFFTGTIPVSVWQFKLVSSSPFQKAHLAPCIKCENKEKDQGSQGSFEQVSVERYPYHSYMDSTSGQLEPASGARASIPGQEYWPEGTASRVRAARAPEPTGTSTGTPSYGKNPGSRRKKYKASAAASKTSDVNIISDDPTESPDNLPEEPKDLSSEYVIYQPEQEEEELTGYELDKRLGKPHPFIDPKTKKEIEKPLTSEELWWNWRKPEKEQWSRWQRRRPDVETVFLKAMAETGQVKLYGDHPTLTETDRKSVV